MASGGLRTDNESFKTIIDGQEVLVSSGRYFGQAIYITCDMQCNKAWGHCERPKIQLSEDDEDDWAYLADSEVGVAPVEPGSWEGGDSKPLQVPEIHNKWCCRECERSRIISKGDPLTLKDFSKRFANCPNRTGYENG